MNHSIPCGGDLAAAYANANAGDTLTLSACAYPAVTLSYDSSKGSAPITIQGVKGTTIADVEIMGAQHLIIRDLQVLDTLVLKARDGSGGGPLASDIQVINVKTGLFFSRNAQNVTVTGGQWGPYTDLQPTIGSYDGVPISKNVTVDGVHITGIQRSAQGIHLEAIFIQDVDNFTLKNCRLDNNSVYDAAIGGLYGGTKNFLIQNNYFASTTDGYYAVLVADGNGSSLNSPPSTGRFENNTFEQGIQNESVNALQGCGNKKVGTFTWPGGAFEAACGTPPPPPPPPPPPSTTPKELLQQGLVNLKAASLYKNWAKANPGELSAINAWVANPSSALPSPKTEFGKFYLKYSQAIEGL